MPEIKNLQSAAKRILQAVKNKERIILYGDADPDGAASVIILKEAIEEQGGSVLAVYFPDREKEGYGINEKALRYLAKRTSGLLIALDCGIGNVQEVELAKKLGFEVIIIDHHQVPPGLLPGTLVVNPNQKTDKYPFKGLSSAGIVYRLVNYMSCGIDGREPNDFLSLAALSTLADQMPLLDENRRLVKEGLRELFFTERKGMLALLEFFGFSRTSRLSRSKIRFFIGEARQKIVPILNAAKIKNHLNEAYLLLTRDSLAKARLIVRELVGRAEKRRQEIQKIFEEIEHRSQDKTVVFEGAVSWTLSCLGPVASKICQKRGLPTFLFKKMANISRGTVRVPPGVDAVKAMNSCSELLQTYGGHAPAAGFTVKNKNINKFKKCLTEYFRPRL